MLFNFLYLIRVRRDEELSVSPPHEIHLDTIHTNIHTPALISQESIFIEVQSFINIGISHFLLLTSLGNNDAETGGRGQLPLMPFKRMPFLSKGLHCNSWINFFRPTIEMKPE